MAANVALQNFLGYSEEELKKTKIQTLTPNEDLDAHFKNERLLLSGQADSIDVERRYVRKDGQIVWGSLMRSLIRNDDGQPLHILAQIMDITDQHRLDHMKREFISVVGHELRTPVTVISGALDLIDMLCPDGPTEQVQSLVKTAKRGSDRLRRMLDEILDFEKLTTIMEPLDLVHADVVKIIEGALTEAEQTLDRYKVSVSLISEESSIKWLCDRSLLHKVLICLISNAAKFSPEGSEARIIVTQEQGGLHIRVKDQGRGIPPELHKDVFEPFWQQDPSDTREHQGIGLGLSVSQHAVRQMGGELSIEPVEGPGAEFLISLPETS